MKHIKPLIGLILTVTLLASCTQSNNVQQSGFSNQHRSAENMARDAYRHPQQTLDFFEVRANMTVVEIWPGGGWYSEILAAFLRDNGRLYAAHFSATANVDYFTVNLKRFIDKTTAQPEIYAQMILTELDPPSKVEIAPAGSADRVLTFRNVHNWMKSGQANTVFNAMYHALKPGGILGVVEHRAGLDTLQDPQAKSGYVREDYVIQLAENAGFKLLAKSEINANPKDTKNHPAGVWTLPPSLRLKDKNRAQYIAIGESDRMTLKFVKPE
jgi:predicted methyltransferase